MALTLYSHPLASFCHKVLIALYEKELPFNLELVDFANPAASARFLSLWPVGKIPLLHDDQNDRTVPETSIIIEYLEQIESAKCSLLPSHVDDRLETRLWDRFYDCYVQVPMQKIVIDRLRPQTERDARGVAEARSALRAAYDMIERRMTERSWAVGDEFTMADCAAAPALFYAGIVEPFDRTHPNVTAYFERLLQRASVQKVIIDARPYFDNFPYRDAMPERFIRGVRC